MSDKNKLEKKGHEGRYDLVGEHKFGDSGQMIFLVVFLIVWILDTFIFNYTDFIASHIPMYIRIALAVLILLCGIYIAIGAHNTIFKEVREKPEVIRNGIFGRVRHPLYLGAIMFYLALLTFSCSLAALFIFVLITAFYHFIARYEEKLMIEKFGDDYSRYMQEVPMWIPRLMRSGPNRP